MHVVNNKKRKTFLTLKSVLTLAAVSVLSMAAFNAHAGFFKLIDRKTDYAAVDGAEVAVVSSDGNYLYVGGTDGHTLSVFSVAATTGKLTLVETLRDGENSVDGISGVVDIEISNNGNYLIVAAYSDETSGITVFTRDIQTGRLNYAYSVVAPNENGFNVVSNITSISLTPDNRHLYATTRASLLLLSFDETAGEISLIKNYDSNLPGLSGLPVSSLLSATNVEVSPDGNNVYATAMNQGSLLGFERNKNTGDLTLIQFLSNTLQQRSDAELVEGLTGATSLTINSDGSYVYVAGNYENGPTVFRRDPLNGRLTWVATSADIQHPMTVKNNISGNLLYVTSRELSQLQVYEIDNASGLMTPKQVLQNNVDGVEGLGGAYAIAVSPNDNFVFVTGGDDDSVMTLAKSTDTSGLSVANVVWDQDFGLEGVSGACCVLLTPDGKNVIVASSQENSVTNFSRNVDTGSLSATQLFKYGQNNITAVHLPIDIDISPGGDHVYVASYDIGSISLFNRNLTTGDLDFVTAYGDQTRSPLAGGNAGLLGVVDIALTNGGKYLYAVTDYEQSIRWFSRNPATGELQFVNSLNGDYWAEIGLYELKMHDVAISHDNAYLYVNAGNTLLTFSINDTTGDIVFQSQIPILGGFTISISPDGQSLYLLSDFGDPRLTVFKIDIPSGQLQLVEIQMNGKDRLNELGGVGKITSSYDSRYVYVTNNDSNALIVFERDPTTLALHYLDTEKQSTSEVNASSGIYGVAAGFDTRFLYVTRLNGSLDTYDVNTNADITLALKSVTDPLFPEQANTLSYLISNQGPDAVTSVYFEGEFPPDVDLRDAVFGQSPCVIQNSKVMCEIGELATAETTTIAINMAFPNIGSGLFKAVVRAAVREPNIANNELKIPYVVQFSSLPIVGDDILDTLEDLDLVTSSLLQNDSDPDGDALSIVSVDSISEHGGSLINNGDGSVSYHPPQDFFGVDSFSYLVGDGKGSRVTGKVSVNVASVNDLPVAQDDMGSTTENQALILDFVLNNDTDKESAALSIESFDSVSSEGGKIYRDNSNNLVYFPPDGYVGVDYFKYTVVDEDAGAAEATVTIDVLPPSQEPKNPNKDTKSGNGGGGLLFWETFFFMLIYLLRISAGSVQKVK